MAEPNPDIDALMAEFARSGVRELHVRHGGFELYLANDPALGGRGISYVPSRRAAPAAPIAPKPVSAGLHDLPEGAILVRAPNLGTFYGAPKPGAAAYVAVGDVVAAGDELCLIEVMKLFTTIRADVAGRVHAILVEDGTMVEAGRPLFAIVAD